MKDNNFEIREGEKWTIFPATQSQDISAWQVVWDLGFWDT